MLDDPRLVLMGRFLERHAQTHRLDPKSAAPASADASFRRYFRVQTETGSLIVMDAPPPHEDVRPFVRVAKLLEATGVGVPRVLEADVEDGLLLLTDLGATTYLHKLQAEPASTKRLYEDAVQCLVRMQSQASAEGLPSYDRERLMTEMKLFPDWYIERHLGVNLTAEQTASLQGVFEALLENNLAQPVALVHRDYHCRNLMVTDENNPGVLDFQDAVVGPLTYDLVSLLRDAYIEWEEAQQIDWVARYWQAARKADLPVGEDFGLFYRDFEWMGLQRHLKVLGIFARLYHRDGKDGYLKDLPLVLKYARKVAGRYAAFKPLEQLFDALDAKPAGVGYTF